MAALSSDKCWMVSGCPGERRRTLLYCLRAPAKSPAREGLFLRGCANLHPRTGTPATALVYQGIVSVLLTFTGSYSRLLTYIMFASVFFTGLMVAAVYGLRVKQPDLPRPYRCWGYPLTPALYLAICLAFLVYVIIGDPLSSGIGLLLMASGIPFYAIWRRRAKSV